MATIKAAGSRTAGSSGGHLSQSGVSSGQQTLPLTKSILPLRHFGKITMLAATLQLAFRLILLGWNV